MDGRINPFVHDHEDYENSPENSEDSPPSAMFTDTKTTSTTSSPKTSKRGAQKRVVYVPIKDVEGCRLKGEMSSPPSDSWAWRKYGQKPIKGSPYPRGYYRCSSSKGCPARKQVERSRTDPTTLMVTYSCDHNHPWPASKNIRIHNRNHSQNIITSSSTSTVTTSSPEVVISGSDHEDDLNPTVFQIDEKFTNFEGSLVTEFGWFSDFESTSATMLESPMLARDHIEDADVATIFSMGEEDESLFADLGELPECSVVFRRGMMEKEEELRRCSLAPPL